MTEQLVNSVKQIVIVVVLTFGAVGGYWVHLNAGTRPDAPAPTIPDLDKSVAKAVDSEDALKFAALYTVARDLLDRQPPAQVRDNIGEARTILGLDDPELRAIVRELLQPYGGSSPDVAAFKADLQRLIDALLRAA